MNPVLGWIRRDLSLNNNPTLKSALKDGKAVIPVFILDDRLQTFPFSNRRRFLFSGLHELNNQLLDKGSGLVIRQGNPAVELRKLVQETGTWMIFAEEDYSPFARQRDTQVARNSLCSL